MMQHRWTDFVSVKGAEKLARLMEERANRQDNIAAAGKRVAGLFGDSAWIILSVDPGREQVVEKLLNEADIEACVPSCLGPVRRRHHKELPPSQKPVFIGYVFVRCAPSADAWAGLKAFDHVRGRVGGWGGPCRLSDDMFNQFREKAERGAYDWEVKADTLPKGCRVRVKEGPFAEFEGTVIAFGGAGKGSPVIELEIFGRPTPIMIPLAMLARV